MSFKIAGLVNDSAGHIGTDPFTVSVPSVNNGDLLLLVANRNVSGLFTTPAGWTQIDVLQKSSTSFQPYTTLIAYRIANNEPASYDITHTDSTSKAQSACIIAYDPVNAAIFDVTPASAHAIQQNDNNTPTVPNITTVTDGAILIALQWVSNAEITSASGPSGFAMRLDHSPFTNRNILIADMVQTTAGLVSPGAWLHTTSAQYGDGATAIIALKPVEANQAPVLNDDLTSIQIQEGEIGTIAADFTDPNSGDTLTYSITPDITLVQGFGFNTSTGEISYDGTQVVAAGVEYTRRATDTGGLFVEDTFTIVVSNFSADSITGGDLTEGATRRINLSNAPSASGRVVSIGAGALTVVDEGEDYVDIQIPANLRTFGDLTGDYNVNTVFTIVDGAQSTTISAPILPASGYEVGAIAALEGYWAESEVTGVEIGDYYYAPIIQGADHTVGVVPVLETEQIVPVEYKDLTDNTWKEGFIFTIQSLVPLESNTLSVTVLPPTGYSYVILTGIDENSWLNDPQYTGNAGGDANNIGVGDQIVYKNTTIEEGTDVVIDSNGLVTLPNAVADNITYNQSFTWYYLEAQENYLKGPTATLTLEVPIIIASLSSITNAQTLYDTTSDVAATNILSNIGLISNTQTVHDISTDIEVTDKISNIGLISNTQTVHDITSLVEAVIEGPTENVENPMPGNFYVSVNVPYQLSQHVTNPNDAPLNYAVAQGSPSLPTGITLNSSTGELTASINNYTTVNGIYFEVTLA